MRSQKYYYYRRHIGDPSETDMSIRRRIKDLDMLHRRPTSLIGYPPETNMPHRRPTYPSEADMLHRRPTCLWDHSETNLAEESNRTTHVLLRWFVDQAFRSLMMSVSYGSLMKHVEVSNRYLISHVGLRWVYVGSPMSLKKKLSLTPQISC